ncbi:MAG TPA: hypothetical protein V6C86_25640 [Oculatellaceae cyanobacterium]
MVLKSASRKPFSSNDWKTTRTDQASSARLKEVDDLVRSGKLIGLSRESVQELLGIPDSIKPELSEYIYRLGPERNLISIDEEWLVVHFRNGSVTSANIMID